jgi:hypothetical protein
MYREPPPADDGEGDGPVLTHPLLGLDPSAQLYGEDLTSGWLRPRFDCPTNGSPRKVLLMQHRARCIMFEDRGLQGCGGVAEVAGRWRIMTRPAHQHTTIYCRYNDLRTPQSVLQTAPLATWVRRHGRHYNGRPVFKTRFEELRRADVSERGKRKSTLVR